MKRMAKTALTFALSLCFGAALAGSVKTVKIGVMNDSSGVFADGGGERSTTVAKLAVEDFMAAHPNAGFKVDVVLGNHQNKADVGSAIARKWFTQEGVDAIIDLPNSGVALAVSALAAELNKAVLVSGAGSTRLTGDMCNKNTVHWTYDTYATAQGSVKATARPGRDKWFFIVADYSFGHNLEENATAAVKAMGYKSGGFGPRAAGYV